MYVLGHAGLTLGVSWAAETLARRRKQNSQGKVSGLPLDHRFALMGSMLPDLVDKPIGIWLFADVFGSSRIFTHTLLVNVLLVGLGLWAFRRGGVKKWLLLGLASMGHLLLDQMWVSHATLFWPAFGFRFPQVDVEAYRRGLWERLWSEPGIFVPEVVGGCILVALAITLVRRRAVAAFVKRGTMNPAWQAQSQRIGGLA